MHNSKESELLGKIETLEARIIELKIQNDSLRAGLDGSSLFTQTRKRENSNSTYLRNFIAAAVFPFVAGFFRVIYKKIYGLKK
jgi:hypothetical protein